MSFKKELQQKGLDILDAVAARKKEAANRPPEDIESKPFSTAPGRMGEYQDRKWLTNRVNELTQALEDAKAGGRNLELPLADLHEVEGRRRKLTQQEFGELKENLANNPLVTPITVRPRQEGGYEIISGHNRVRAFRELGRDLIPAVIVDTSDAQADINAFYANLLQTDLPPYEKYLGFKMLQEKQPGLTQAEIARQAGKPESTISELMAFGELPEPVLTLLSHHPSLLGHRAAAQLAAFTKNGLTQEVTDAVQQIASLGIDQNEAVKMVAATQKKEVRPKPPKRVIKAGRATYCSVIRAAKVMRIEFASEDEAAAVQAAIEEVLESRAQNLKK